jgi:hypothetical protein
MTRTKKDDAPLSKEEAICELSKQLRDEPPLGQGGTAAHLRGKAAQPIPQ